MPRYSKERTLEVLEEVNRKVVAGGYVNDILKGEGMPSVFTFYKWLKDNPEYKEEFRLAQQFRATLMIDEINKIADDQEHDYIEVEFYDERGEMHIEKQWSPIRLNQRRFQVQTRQWEAGKLCRIYGDKVTNEIVTPEGVEVKITIDD